MVGISVVGEVGSVLQPQRKLMARKFQIIVWGSTGFTGNYVLKYLRDNYPEIRLALGGRSKSKLLTLKQQLNLNDSVGIFEADIDDPLSLDAMMRETKVLLTTAGPYAKIGTNILTSCIRCETHYCDLTGEAQWVRKVVDDHDGQAKEKKVKIVNSCGFDCIPSDMGNWMLVNGMKKKSLTPKEVCLVADSVKGGASGGTIASVINIFESSSWAQLIEFLDPFYLAPRDNVTNSPIRPTDKRVVFSAMDSLLMGFDSVFKVWTIPYVMQSIDTRIVNRSNALSGWSFGRNFLYTERMRAPNFLFALMCTLLMPFGGLLLLMPFTRAVIKAFAPKSGEGPNEELVEEGFFKIKLWGRGTDACGGIHTVTGGITALHGDPGYKQTAKMVSEAALCMVLDEDKLPQTFGLLTPSVAFGKTLISRLQTRGIDFYFEDQPFVP